MKLVIAFLTVCLLGDMATLPARTTSAAERSPHARARIRSIDASRARAQRGVHLVLTAAELGALNQPTPLLIPHPELKHPRTPCPLAIDEVRFAGELVAFVVADDRYLAQDAAR